MEVYLLGAKHPDGQTERVKFVVEDILRCVCSDTPWRWSSMLPVVEFALNNSIHASIGYTLFYVNGLTHQYVPLKLPRGVSGIGEEGLLIDQLLSALPLLRNRWMSFSRCD